MCLHLDVYNTDYGTRVCKHCGSEAKVGLPTSDQYTTNCPLVVGYSRNARVKSILEQLFEPFLYGKPCQEIVYIIKRDKLHFESGKDLHKWLNKFTNKFFENKDLIFSSFCRQILPICLLSFAFSKTILYTDLMTSSSLSGSMATSLWDNIFDDNNSYESEDAYSNVNILVVKFNVFLT